MDHEKLKKNLFEALRRLKLCVLIMLLGKEDFTIPNDERPRHEPRQQNRN